MGQCCGVFICKIDSVNCQGGSILVYKEECSAGFPGGGAWGSLTVRSPLQSATLLSQHYHYLRWPNLHVRRSVTFYINYVLYIKFISAFIHVCVTGQLRCSTVHVSKFACYSTVYLKIWLYNNLDMFTYLTMIFNYKACRVFCHGFTDTNS
jgi:hypothetical protein